MSAVRQALRPRRRGLRRAPWLLALPGVAALFAFHFVPVGLGGYYAFTNWDGARATWLGLDNLRLTLEMSRGIDGKLKHEARATLMSMNIMHTVGVDLSSQPSATLAIGQVVMALARDLANMAQARLQGLLPNA